MVLSDGLEKIIIVDRNRFFCIQKLVFTRIEAQKMPI